ncbi:DUF6880 family protein [Desulfovibrio inopinatus]|uniref:DUF6880 family protein n=1 Tax=Desulfovibrio inopinatus TaxID=102109 RepID=UPI00040A7F2E|nr:DUF6880 family protein [Desulfovibrio inopinatus]
MPSNIHNKLVALGVEALADALMELASRCETGQIFIDRLLLSNDQASNYFSNAIKKLGAENYFISWRESEAFTAELEQLLGDIKSKVGNPQSGIELTCQFFEIDKAILERSDDSSGSIGAVFSSNASDLFSFYASQCPEKDWILEKVINILRNDQYNVRDALLNHAKDFLDTDHLQQLADHFSEKARNESDDYEQRVAWSYIQTLARQLNNPKLFEQARLATTDKHDTTNSYLDIAKAYLKSGKPEVALSWIEKISPDDVTTSYDKHNLLIEIHGKLGNPKEQEKAAWTLFRWYRDKENLEKLLNIVGKDKKARIIADETAIILKVQAFNASNLKFLCENGRFQEAEEYILDREDQLNGENHYFLEPIANTMEKQGFHLPAVIIYRQLLESVLERRNSKYYHHGIRYLKKLDKITNKISDWKNRTPHQDYFHKIYAEHKRKTAFWSKYR